MIQMSPRRQPNIGIGENINAIVRAFRARLSRLAEGARSSRSGLRVRRTRLATAQPGQSRPDALTFHPFKTRMRSREFSDLYDHADEIPSLGTRAVRR